MELADVVKKARQDRIVERQNDPKNIKQRWYKKRYQLFTKFDEGIRVSDTMWFSVTPEQVANIVAQSLRSVYPAATTVVDVCGGAGGNTIAFSKSGLKTVYVDIDPSVCQDAAHNAQIYGCFDIDYHVADFCELDLIKVGGNPEHTVVHVSPEWGGPSYKNAETFDLDNCVPTCEQIVKQCRDQGFDNIMLYLPKNSSLQQLSNLGCCRVDNVSVDSRQLAIVAYWTGPGGLSEQEQEQQQEPVKKSRKSKRSSQKGSDQRSKLSKRQKRELKHQNESPQADSPAKEHEKYDLTVD